MTSILTITSVSCLDQQETFGDETYLNFGGKAKVWHSKGDMTNGEVQSVNESFLFNGSAPLSFFEDDGNHWYDRDDHIGTKTISEGQGAGSPFTLQFAGDGAHYSVVMSVFDLPFDV
jgi:hypothetical protein